LRPTASHSLRCLSLTICHVIRRIHGAIVAATIGAIVATTNTCLINQLAIVAAIAATIAPTGCGDDRPVYTPY